MTDVKYATLRMANDQYRQIIYKAQMFANTGAGTVKQAIDMACKDFWQEDLIVLNIRTARDII